MSPWLFKFKGWLGEGVDAEQSSKKSVNVRSTSKRLTSDQSRFPHPREACHHDTILLQLRKTGASK
jgi:hypothetical protein